jgi:uncharacterized membrane protein YfhO
VNGQPHYIGIVNEAFRGLALPAGRHVIEMTYAPHTLFRAEILTVLGLLIAFALFAFRRQIDPLLAKILAWRVQARASTVPAAHAAAKV